MHMTELCADPILCFLKYKSFSWCPAHLFLCYIRLDCKILPLSPSSNNFPNRTQNKYSIHDNCQFREIYY